MFRECINMSKWIEHIKQFAKEKGMTYKDAMKCPECKASYNKVKGKGVEPKVDKTPSAKEEVKLVVTEKVKRGRPRKYTTPEEAKEAKKAKTLESNKRIKGGNIPNNRLVQMPEDILRELLNNVDIEEMVEMYVFLVEELKKPIKEVEKRNRLQSKISIVNQKINSEYEKYFDDYLRDIPFEMGNEFVREELKILEKMNDRLRKLGFVAKSKIVQPKINKLKEGVEETCVASGLARGVGTSREADTTDYMDIVSTPKTKPKPKKKAEQTAFDKIVSPLSSERVKEIEEEDRKKKSSKVHIGKGFGEEKEDRSELIARIADRIIKSKEDLISKVSSGSISKEEGVAKMKNLIKQLNEEEKNMDLGSTPNLLKVTYRQLERDIKKSPFVSEGTGLKRGRKTKAEKQTEAIQKELEGKGILLAGYKNEDTNGLTHIYPLTRENVLKILEHIVG